MFEHEDLSHLIKDEAVEVTIEGKRHYTSALGLAYPSISTILGYQAGPWLHEWRKRVGAEEANRIGRKAATNGTKVHTMAEDYINNEYELPESEMPYYKQVFWALQKALKPLTKVHAQEVRLYSDYLQIAGRCDTVGVYNGKISIIDFKTSKRIKTHEQLENYFVQTCAYAIMFEERTGIPINQLVIISLIEGQNDPVVSIEKRNTWWPKLKGYIKDYQDFHGKPTKLL